MNLKDKSYAVSPWHAERVPFYIVSVDLQRHAHQLLAVPKSRVLSTTVLYRQEWCNLIAIQDISSSQKMIPAFDYRNEERDIIRPRVK
jgi:hypothetical protein